MENWPRILVTFGFMGKIKGKMHNGKGTCMVHSTYTCIVCIDTQYVDDVQLYILLSSSLYTLA